MDISVVKNQIALHVCGNFYIFTGDEIEIQRIYCNKISEVSNKTIRRIDSAGDIYKSSGSSLLKENYCYICRDDMDFVKSEKAWGNIRNAIGDNILILLYTKLDKRGKFYKTFLDDIVVFDYLHESILLKYLNRDTKLSDANCKRLIALCENDYSKMVLELDKVMQYKEVTNLSDDQCFIDLLDSGVLHVPPNDAIFDFVDAVIMGKPKKSLLLLQDCYAIGEPSLRLLLVLYNNFKQVLQVQACESKDIAGNTGLNSWEVKRIQPKCGIYSNGELVNALRVIREAEIGIKTGKIEEAIAVEYALAKIF